MTSNQPSKHLVITMCKCENTHKSANNKLEIIIKMDPNIPIIRSDLLEKIEITENSQQDAETLTNKQENVSGTDLAKAIQQFDSKHSFPSQINETTEIYDVATQTRTPIILPGENKTLEFHSYPDNLPPVENCMRITQRKHLHAPTANNNWRYEVASSSTPNTESANQVELDLLENSESSQCICYRLHTLKSLIYLATNTGSNTAQDTKPVTSTRDKKKRRKIQSPVTPIDGDQNEDVKFKAPMQTILCEVACESIDSDMLKSNGQCQQLTSVSHNLLLCEDVLYAVTQKGGEHDSSSGQHESPMANDNGRNFPGSSTPKTESSQQTANQAELDLLETSGSSRCNCYLLHTLKSLTRLSTNTGSNRAQNKKPVTSTRDKKKCRKEVEPPETPINNDHSEHFKFKAPKQTISCEVQCESTDPDMLKSNGQRQQLTSVSHSLLLHEDLLDTVTENALGDDHDSSPEQREFPQEKSCTLRSYRDKSTKPTCHHKLFSNECCNNCVGLRRRVNNDNWITYYVSSNPTQRHHLPL